MSWLNLPPVSRVAWNGFADANSLLQILPALPPGAARTGAGVAPLVYYRYLIAAMLRHNPFAGDRARFCAATADFLWAPPPDAVIDWRDFRDNGYYPIYAGHNHAIGGGGWHALPIEGTTALEMLTWYIETGGPVDANSLRVTRMAVAAWPALARRLADAVRAVIGYPWRPAVRPAWRTTDALSLARGLWADRAWDRTPILADALQDAGCDDGDLLDHLRDTTVDRSGGCWAVLDVILPPSPI